MTFSFASRAPESTLSLALERVKSSLQRVPYGTVVPLAALAGVGVVVGFGMRRLMRLEAQVRALESSARNASALDPVETRPTPLELGAEPTPEVQLDQGLNDSFPASDPPSITVPSTKPTHE